MRSRKELVLPVILILYGFITVITDRAIPFNNVEIVHRFYTYFVAALAVLLMVITEIKHKSGGVYANKTFYNIIILFLYTIFLASYITIGFRYFMLSVIYPIIGIFIGVVLSIVTLTTTKKMDRWVYFQLSLLIPYLLINVMNLVNRLKLK